MDFHNLKEHTRENILSFTISGILIVLFYVLVRNIPALFSVLGKFFTALTPFLLGICFAFVMTPMRSWLETKVFAGTEWKDRTKRIVAVIICMIVMLCALTAFFAVWIPDLIASLRMFIESFAGYVSDIQAMIEKMDISEPIIKEMLNRAVESATNIISGWLTGAEGGISKILSFSISFAKGIMNFFIGVIISAYLLLDEEKFIMQIRKTVYGIFSVRQAHHIMYLSKLTSGMFNSFIFGKALDSLIIGIITWFCMYLMKMPYTPLIAVVVGVTNMIPVFGPFLGAVPCIIILVIIDPIKALEFAIFILILQQIDGNIIGPRILGDSMGLPTLWIMFAIIVGGALFGVVGMFLGVPLFSVIYVLIRDWIYGRLADKNIKFQ